VIDGERIYVSIQEYETKSYGDCRFETHKRYADIQCILQGREQIWVTEQPLLTPDTEYDPKADIRFWKAGSFCFSPCYNAILNTAFFTLPTSPDRTQGLCALMLERRIKQEIRDFLDGDRKEALMVTGARQVGKTYIIRECAKEIYKNIVEINFVENQQAVKLFANTTGSKDILLTNFLLYASL